jgi:hypothetical protein
MNIQTIRDNLLKTIEGKEKYLASLPNTRGMSYDTAMAIEATRSMVEINLDELKKILKDVTICCTNETIAKWIESPDRSGGQYTEEEINRKDW